MTAAACLAVLLLTADPAPAGAGLEVYGRPTWIEGGQRLAVTARVGTAVPAWYTTAVGGQLELVKPRPMYESVDNLWWRPNGDRFAYVGQVSNVRTLLVGRRDAVDGVPFAVVGNIRPTVGGWSADGSHLAFGLIGDRTVPKPFSLFSCEEDGAHGVHVPMNSPPLGMTWEPGAQRIAFINHDAGRSVLYVCMLSQGMAVTVNSYLRPLPHSLAMPAGGALIAFAATGLHDDDDPHWFVALVGVRQPAQKLDSQGYAPDQPPVWSPDSQWLAWTAGPRSDPEQGNLFLAATTELAKVTRVVAGRAGAGQPAFSPDGHDLVFTAYDSWQPRTARLAWLKLGRPEPPRLLTVPDNPEWPTFAPDGRRLACVAAGQLKVIDWPPPE